MYPGETFVDVGAVVGSYTLMVAEEYKTKGVKVIAVEDHPENYKALCKNVECNNFKNIKTVSKAVSDTKGNVTMYKQNDTQRSRSGQYTSLFNALVTSNGTPCELECDTLDDIIGNDGADLMKLDIEGAEVLALKGATNSLKRLRKIIVEVHGNNFEKVKHILEIHQFKLGVYLLGSESDALTLLQLVQLAQIYLKKSKYTCLPRSIFFEFRFTALFLTCLLYLLSKLSSILISYLN